VPVVVASATGAAAALAIGPAAALAAGLPGAARIA